MNKVYFITGLPSSGKTTLAKALTKALGDPVKHLDGDGTRRRLCSDLGFGAKDRAENIRRIAWLAKSFHEQGYNVICSYVSPYKAGRDFVRGLFEPGEFVEIYLSTSATECARRDPKGLWAQAKAGSIKGFTGVDDPYEAPREPEWAFDTGQGCNSVPTMIRWILDWRAHDRTSLFIGRWQPLHEGHIKLIRSALDIGNYVVVGIRDIPLSQDNPYDIQERVKMLTDAFPDKKDRDKIEWISIPEKTGGLEICYGRKVGWGIREIHLDEPTEAISGTKIRAAAEDG